MSNERFELNKNLAQMLKGGVIMDVTTPEQAKIAEEAGACAVMALERIPADIRAAGGVSRMSDPKMIKGIQEAVLSLQGAVIEHIQMLDKLGIETFEIRKKSDFRLHHSHMLNCLNNITCTGFTLSSNH